MKNPRKYKAFYRYNLLSSFCRHLHTTQEIRQNDYDINYNDDTLEYSVKIRSSRSRRMIPTTWDDLRVTRWDTWKSWKSHSKRNKQWVPLDDGNQKPTPIWDPAADYAVEYYERDRKHDRFFFMNLRDHFYDDGVDDIENLDD